MRRVFSLLLVLVLVFSVSCVAFADHFVPSVGEPCDNHDWHNGICKKCGATCEHVFVGGYCKYCGDTCKHAFVGGYCKYCGVRKHWFGDNPKTGDMILFWVAVMLTSVAAMGGLAVVYRKKFRR